jgi:hypothetical protein
MKSKSKFYIISLASVFLGALIITFELSRSLVGNLLNISAILLALVSIVFGFLSFPNKKRTLVIIGMIIDILIIIQAAFLILILLAFSSGRFDLW